MLSDDAACGLAEFHQHGLRVELGSAGAEAD
jgi:hypothetical protein